MFNLGEHCMKEGLRRRKLIFWKAKKSIKGFKGNICKQER